jgi:RNA polymerase sigma-70 factor (ECF subfamily)
MGSARRRHAESPASARVERTATPESEAVAPQIDVVELRSFEELYRAEWGSMVGLAYTLTGSRAVAEDLTQEAMLRAYREWGRVSSYDNPATWVRRVVLNLAASRWRRRRSATKAMWRWRTTPEVVEPDEFTEQSFCELVALGGISCP